LKRSVPIKLGFSLLRASARSLTNRVYALSALFGFLNAGTTVDGQRYCERVECV